MPRRPPACKPSTRPSQENRLMNHGSLNFTCDPPGVGLEAETTTRLLFVFAFLRTLRLVLTACGLHGGALTVRAPRLLHPSQHIHTPSARSLPFRRAATANLGLVGLCCPTVVGDYLHCCDET